MSRTHGIPDIQALPCQPLLQTLVSRDTWVVVNFFGANPPTKAEILRSIELLCMMHNGWTDELPKEQPND